VAGLSGCTRNFFRQRADDEVAQVLGAKDKYPQWKIDNWHVYPDPLARFADPTNPDRPPMPPDDPAARDLSPNPQKPPCKGGIARIEGTGYLNLLAQWNAQNRKKQEEEKSQASQEKDPGAVSAKEDVTSKETGATAGNTASSTLAASERIKPYLLNFEQAIELGLINSREYQDRREDLYMTALPVTLQRFSFAAQTFAAQEAIREYSGRKTPQGQHNDWNITTGTGLAKLFPTGALLLLNFANRTFIDFINPKKTTSESTLSLDIVQPLLQGGGKAVTLEPLTQAERNLLYEIRSYARFRKEFFVSIAAGVTGGSFVPGGTISNVDVSPTSGLGGSGLSPGSIGRVATTLGSLPVSVGSSGRLILSGAIPASVSGYLGTLLQHVQIAIDEENISNLQDFLKRFQDFEEGDIVTPLQVQTVEQQLLRGRSTLLADQQEYLSFIDNFKIQLGLPTDLPLALDDAPLQPLLRQFQRSREIIEQEKAAVDQAGLLKDLDTRDKKIREKFLQLFTSSAIVQGTRFSKQLRNRWEKWSSMSDGEVEKRLKELEGQREELREKTKKQALSEDEQRNLRQQESEIDLGSFEKNLRDYEVGRHWQERALLELGASTVALLGAPLGQGPISVSSGLILGTAKKPDLVNREKRRQKQFDRVVNHFAIVLVEARDERLIPLRESWPQLPPVCVEGVDLLKGELEAAEAVVARTALQNRLDLMNVRAQTVDAWRQVAVFANALLGTFNVRYHLDSYSPLGQAKLLNIGGSGNRHQLILDTELPLVRMVERNNYRASLIAYQRQRRALMEAEDLVLQAVRNELRQLRVLAENYKIQQQQLELAYITVDNSLESLNAPPPPGPSGASTSATAAALTQQLLNAQSSLPAAQTSLLTVWVSYLNTRMQLYRDLELLPLDQRGVWIDDIRTCDRSIVAGPSSGPSVSTTGPSPTGGTGPGSP
jgi:hypothetical protein